MESADPAMDLVVFEVRPSFSAFDALDATDFDVRTAFFAICFTSFLQAERETEHRTGGQGLLPMQKGSAGRREDMERKDADQEERLQELREQIRHQERRILLCSVSILVLAVSFLIGSWRVHLSLVRICEQIRSIIGILNVRGDEIGLIQQIADLLAGINELIQKCSFF